MEMIAVLLLGFDRQAYIYSGHADQTGYVMVRLSNFMVFFMTSAVVWGFNLYLTDWLRNEGNMEVLPIRLKLVQTISTLGMFLAVVSAFTGLYYYFDENNKYHRGGGFLIAYIIPVLCPIIQYTVIQQYRKKFSRLIYISMVLYIFVPIVCGIIQIFTYGLSLVNMAMVLVSIFMYIFAYLDINNEVVRVHELELEGLHEAQKSMERLFEQTTTAFVTAVEKKDEFFEGHSVKVAEYARKIAELCGKNEEDCEKAYYAGLLHDVGLIGIPDSVIKNETDPDKWNREILRRKPVIGREILSSITEYSYLSDGAYYSHERYDGKGYPEGLKEEEIPEIARIIAVADDYVTMTSRKRYRDARPDFAAREVFVEESGGKYDPQFANCMVRIIDQNNSEENQEKALDIERELVCMNYREHITNGIRVEDHIIKITFDCTLEAHPASGFCAPSLLLFHSLNQRVHEKEKAIKEYQYTEFGEVWFDDHSIVTEAREIKERRLPSAEHTKKNRYEIIAGRYEDHVKLIMKSPHHAKEVIAALPDGSKAVYIGLTGEHCRLNRIHVEKTEKKVEEAMIPRIADKISYIDRMESDLKNIQIDRTRSAATSGVEIKKQMRLRFHTMSLPGASFVWHCPYLLLFTSDDANVGGENYKEYALIKLNGENEGADQLAKNKFSMKKKENFPGWEAWKSINQAGMECEVFLERKGKRIIVTTENLGIQIENVTELLEAPEKVYAALTGDQCALTDIRVAYL